MVPLFHGGPEIAVAQIPEIAAILFPERFIEMELCFQLLFDFGRSGDSLFIEWTAGSKSHQGKGEKADDDHQRNHAQDAFEVVHRLKPAGSWGRGETRMRGSGRAVCRFGNRRYSRF